LGRKAFFTGKVYKQPTPGADLEPGTVDWELARRKVRAQQRREDKYLEQKRAEEAEMEPTGFWRIVDATIGFFKTRC
jgi:hypothetical protein